MRIPISRIVTSDCWVLKETDPATGEVWMVLRYGPAEEDPDFDMTMTAAEFLKFADLIADCAADLRSEG